MIRYSAHRWATVMAKARALLEENSVIRSDGVCRLNPEMARCVVGLVARNQKLNCRPAACFYGWGTNFVRVKLPGVM
jgi:hypothetical protein